MPNAVNFLIYPLKLGVITAQTPSRLPKPHLACPNLISPAQTSFRLPKPHFACPKPFGKTPFFMTNQP
jgi:hypothetical protein